VGRYSHSCHTHVIWVRFSQPTICMVTRPIDSVIEVTKVDVVRGLHLDRTKDGASFGRGRKYQI
jgi:hypothetical protein